MGGEAQRADWTGIWPHTHPDQQTLDTQTDRCTADTLAHLPESEYPPPSLVPRRTHTHIHTHTHAVSMHRHTCIHVYAGRRHNTNTIMDTSPRTHIAACARIRVRACMCDRHASMQVHKESSSDTHTHTHIPRYSDFLMSSNSVSRCSAVNTFESVYARSVLSTRHGHSNRNSARKSDEKCLVKSKYEYNYRRSRRSPSLSRIVCSSNSARKGCFCLSKDCACSCVCSQLCQCR